MAESVIVRIAKADVTRVIHEEPAFAELFIAHLLARNSRVEADLVDQLFNSSEASGRILLLWRISARKENGASDAKSAKRHWRR